MSLDDWRAARVRVWEIVDACGQAKRQPQETLDRTFADETFVSLLYVFAQLLLGT